MTAAVAGDGIRRGGLGLRARAVLHVAIALAGIGLVVLSVRHQDPARVREAVARARPVLLLAFLLELGRLVMEACASRAALGPRGARLPFHQLLLAQLVAHGVLNLAPVGRASAEATKATLLGGAVGGAEAAAAGALMQVATFVAVAAVSLGCAAVTLSSPSQPLAHPPTLEVPLAALLLANAIVLAGMGIGLRGLMRSPRAVAWLGRCLPGRASPIARFHAQATRGRLLPVVPALFLVLGMLCQVLQMKVLAGGVGASATLQGAFAAQGVHLVMASLAAFIPGQLGARELAFALSASAMGATPAAATSIALLAHAFQIGLALAGFVALLAWRRPAVARDLASGSAVAVAPAMAAGSDAGAAPVEVHLDRVVSPPRSQVTPSELLEEVGEYFALGLRVRPGDTVVDVGANIGLFSLRAAMACGGALRILAFEPSPETFASLRANFEGQPLLRRGRHRLFQMGLASAEQQGQLLRFYDFARYPTNSTFSLADKRREFEIFFEDRGRRARDRLQAWGRGEAWRRVGAALEAFIAELPRGRLGWWVARRVMGLRQYTVAVDTLSRVLAAEAVERIDVLKIDVEGAELDILRGLDAATWARVEQVVLEAHDRDGRIDELERLMRRHGIDSVVRVLQSTIDNGLASVLLFGRRS